MPFLNKLQAFASDDGVRTAVGCLDRDGLQTLSYAQLTAGASGRIPNAGSSILCAPNSLGLVLDFVAGVAGGRSVAVVDPGLPQRTLDGLRRQLMTAAPVSPSGPPLGTELTDGPGRSTFLLGLTSGTTSIPKAFSRSRLSWQASFEASISYFGLDQWTATLIPGQLSASVFLYGLAECLYAGAPAYLLPEFSVASARHAIHSAGITRLVLVPTMLKMLASRGLSAGEQESGLRTIICGGAKLDAQTVGLARAWAPNAAVIEYYGASELGFIAAGPAPDGGASASPAAVGRPFPGVDISIRDTRGASVPAGTAGTIHVRSQLVSDGYLWGDDGLAFRRDGPWCTVQDQGFLSDDGILHVLGRREDMIVSAGHNVYPHEIELTLKTVPGVTDAVVTGLPDAARGTRISAGIVGDGTTLPTAAALRDAVAAVLPRHSWPHDYFVLPTLPVTGSGKVSRPLAAQWISQEDGHAYRLD